MNDLIQVLRALDVSSLGILAIIVLLFGLVTWLVSHRAAGRGQEITIFWGMHRYRKGVASRANQKKLSQGSEASLGSSISNSSRLKTVLTQEVRVGCVSYPPLFDWQAERGDTRVCGLLADMLQHIEEYCDLTVAYVPLEWDEIVRAIEADSVDLIPCVFPTHPRMMVARFAAIFYEVGLGGVVRANQSKVSSADDLRRDDVRIVVTKGEIGWEHCLPIVDDYGPRERLLTVSDRSITRMMALVKSGAADVAVADSLSCRRFCDELADGEEQLVDVFAAEPIASFGLGVMYPRGDEEFGEWLEAMFRLARSTPRMRAKEAEVLLDYEPTICRAS